MSDKTTQYLQINDLQQSHQQDQLPPCHITVAICTATGKSEYCEELIIFSNFRNKVMLQHPEWCYLPERYDAVTPHIVEKLQQFPDWFERSQKLYDDFFSPCLSFIKQQRHDRAVLMYQVMMLYCEGLLDGSHPSY